MRVIVDDVGVTFACRTIFAGLNLTLWGGTVTAIMAPSGYGKSTLLSIIAGHSQPDHGSSTVLDNTGAAISSPVIEWIVQSSPMLPRRTAVANAALGAVARGMSHTSALSRARSALKNLGVESLADIRVNQLSGGERQRVAVARAITMHSNVLLADEPTASLDAASRRQVSSALALAAGTGAVVVVATHDTSVAEQCDRVVDLTQMVQ